MAKASPDVDGEGVADLKQLLVEALATISAMRAENAALRAEVARLKGLKGPPSIKPSGMERATEPKPAGGGGERSGSGGRRSRIAC